jgi:hypothetical protein
MQSVGFGMRTVVCYPLKDAKAIIDCEESTPILMIIY